jgi:lipopolysaccharide transport system ATP-binding protein
MAEPLIRIIAAGKRYRQLIDPTPLAGGGASRRRRRSKDLWALRDVDLELQAGESLGVLGRNGAGKSTLLAMMAGLSSPSTGSVETRGRIAPLLSVGVGFHQELTGRENVIVNGQLLGLTRADVLRRFDDIVDFAGVGSFIDTPVKFYSSGMYARLGFAVATSVEPDVLLVDEVLSVGDVDFQTRSFERMRVLRASGVAVVLVTHNALALQAFCERGLVLSQGAPFYDGGIDDAVSAYTALTRPIDTLTGSLSLHTPDGTSAVHVEGGETVILTAELNATGIRSPELELLVTQQQLLVHQRRLPLPATAIDRQFTVRLSLALPLVTGDYELSLAVGEAADSRPFPTAAQGIVTVNSRREIHGTLDLQAQLVATG